MWEGERERERERESERASECLSLSNQFGITKWSEARNGFLVLGPFFEGTLLFSFFCFFFSHTFTLTPSC